MTADFSFNVSGSIEQSILFNEKAKKYFSTPDEAKEQFQLGNIVTTISHGGNHSSKVYYIGEGSFVEIGTVVQQSALDSLEIEINSDEDDEDEILRRDEKNGLYSDKIDIAN